MDCLSKLTRAVARPLPFWLALPSFFACGGDNLKPTAPPAPGEAYWDLALDHHAVTMSPRAPYDTLTIHAMARNAAGGALTGLPAPTYLSRDLTKVTVTPGGLVRAFGSGFEPVWIVATLVTDNVRHVDSTQVRSVDIDPPPVVTTFSAHPVPPDSAKRAMSDFNFGGPGFPPLLVRAEDASGVPITDLMVSFRSLNPDVSEIEEVTGLLHPRSMGEVPFTASATMFGVTKADTVSYRIGWPIFAGLTPSLVDPLADTVFSSLGIGGMAAWGDDPAKGGFSIDFDDADLANIQSGAVFAGSQITGLPIFCLFFHFDCTGSGDMTIMPPNRGGIRTFTAPGTYYYHVSPYGTTGRIDVIDER